MKTGSAINLGRRPLDSNTYCRFSLGFSFGFGLGFRLGFDLAFDFGFDLEFCLGCDLEFGHGFHFSKCVLLRGAISCVFERV